jgi:predicted enzyme related to lactoylglutathione lyase
MLYTQARWCGRGQGSSDKVNGCFPFVRKAASFTKHLGYLKGAISMAENTKANIPAVPDMKLELVPVPVSDVDRAKAFYEKAGFQLEVDTRPTDTMRVVQFTPPGSACSIVFGTGMGEITDMKPGSVKGLHLVVADIEIARSALVRRGLEVGEITDIKSVKYAGFSDPDGNLWLLQEFPPELRQPGQSFYKEK